MSNVVSLMDRRRPAPKPDVIVPQSIEGPIEAIIEWGLSNGIDVNNIMFQIRLADFTALLRSELTKKEQAVG